MKNILYRNSFNKNSIFYIKADLIIKVWNNENLRLIYSYNIPNKILTVFGDYESVYVMYQLKNN